MPQLLVPGSKGWAGLAVGTLDGRAPTASHAPLLPRPALLAGSKPGGGLGAGKRPLLNVSAGEILAPSVLFGANFKIPRLAKK